jgi:hypothetical protein
MTLVSQPAGPALEPFIRCHSAVVIHFLLSSVLLLAFAACLYCCYSGDQGRGTSSLLNRNFLVVWCRYDLLYVISELAARYTTFLCD